MVPSWVRNYFKVESSHLIQISEYLEILENYLVSTLYKKKSNVQISHNDEIGYLLENYQNI
jgi:hypothetical protein